jgi:hypothetical protein
MGRLQLRLIPAIQVSQSATSVPPLSLLIPLAIYAITRSINALRATLRARVS